MKLTMLLILISSLTLIQGFILQSQHSQSAISSDRKIEEKTKQETKSQYHNEHQSIVKQGNVGRARLLQAYNIQSLNNFISSLSGQLYYPVTSTGTTYNYAQDNTNNYNQGGSTGSVLPSNIPTPPTFNLSIPQAITGFGPETSTTPTSVTYVNASEILSVLGSNTTTQRPVGGQSVNNQNNQNSNQNSWQSGNNQQNNNNNYFSWGGDSQGNQPQQTRVYQFDVGGSSNGASGNSFTNGGITSLNGLNISQLLSSGLDQDQIAQILATQASIINRNNNPVNLIPQPVNVTSFLNQQQSSSNTGTTSGGNTNWNGNSGSQLNGNQQNSGNFNYSQTNTQNTGNANNQNFGQFNNRTTVITGGSSQTPSIQIQNTTTIITNTTQSSILAAQQQQAQRLALLQQQQQQQQQQYQQPSTSTTSTTVTTTNTTRPGQSVTISSADIQRIIQQQQQQLQGYMVQNTTTSTQMQGSTGMPNTGFSQISITGGNVAQPSSTVFSNIAGTTTNQGQFVTVPNQPAVRNTTTTTIQTSTTSNSVPTTTSTTISSTSNSAQVQFCLSYNLGYCVSCQLSYYLIQGFCYTASTTQGCSVFSPPQCIICMSGYYMFQNQCFRVDQRCSSFDYNNKVCIVCTTGTSPRGTGCA